MGPMIERVAQGMRHGRGPGLEFGEWFCIASNETFLHPVGPHRPPFVMIALEPDLKKIVELAGLGQIASRQMAMVIKNGLLFRELMIKPAGRARLEEENFVNELHFSPIF